MRTIMVLFLLSVLLFSLACSGRLETSVAPVPLELTVNPIPSEIDTNIPKISGKVSDPRATVYVNNSKAMVIEDGTFFTYIEVAPRVAVDVEVRAELSGRSASTSFITTFFPEPFLWIFNSPDTRSDPVRIEGWVSYPDAQIEITGDLVNPVVAIKEDGFFSATFSLSGGFQYPGNDRTYHEIAIRSITPRGTTSPFTEYAAAKSAGGGPNFFLNDVPLQTRKVYAEKGKTLLIERKYNYGVTSPTVMNLEIVPDPARGAVSGNLNVSIEPRSFLAYPDVNGGPRNSTVIIRVGEEVPPGSYFFRANRGDHIEVIVE